jgi:hypothetical protein
MLWKNVSKRSIAPVAADIEIASQSNEDAALRLKRFDRHCINDTGAPSPRFKAGEVNHNNQPYCDFSLPLVSNAESPIRSKRKSFSGMA